MNTRDEMFLAFDGLGEIEVTARVAAGSWMAHAPSTHGSAVAWLKSKSDAQTLEDSRKRDAREEATLEIARSARDEARSANEIAASALSIAAKDLSEQRRQARWAKTAAIIAAISAIIAIAAAIIAAVEAKDARTELIQKR